MVTATAGLGDNLNDAAGRLAVLRLIASRFNFDLFHERQVDAGTNRSVNPRKDA